jgi:divalent metal cation (Fe/Co/Zn/Cd) transporter
MRFFLLRHTARFKVGEARSTELLKYRACGIVFLVLNFALAVMIFFMVYFNRTFEHSEITAIAMAAYTFTAFAMAITSIIKYRKYNSPVYSASKAISLAAACVSMITLESTLLNTFGETEQDGFRRIMLALTGGAVTLVILAMGCAMIYTSTKELTKIRRAEINGTKQ